MKGKAPTTGNKMGPAYSGGESKVAKEAKQGTSGFKRGGKTVDKDDSPVSSANAGRKPRKSGGGVFSSAASGTSRGSGSHY